MAVRPGTFIDGQSVAASDMRLSLGAHLAPAGPLRAREGALGAAITVTAQPTPNMTVSVPAFAAAIDNDGFGFGPVSLVNDGPVTQTIAASSSTNPRRDIIVAQWTGEEAAAGSRGTTIKVVTGTAATVPVSPAVPANSLKLCDIQVPAGATSINNGNITNTLLQTSALGGITPSRTAIDVVGVYPGQFRYRLDIGRLEVFTGAAWVGDYGAVAASLPAGGGWQFSGGYMLPSLLKTPNNVVTFNAVIENQADYTPDAATIDLPFGVTPIPAGFRPQNTCQFIGVCDGTNHRAFIFNVHPDGTLDILATVNGPFAIPAGTRHGLNGSWLGVQ